MLKLLFYSITQCLLLAMGQVFLKIALQKMLPFSWTWLFFSKSVFTNWSLLASGISMLVASLIWFYILKHYDLSLAYPLISISYIFGTIAAIFVFHESVSITRWIGVLLIMLGVAFLTYPGKNKQNADCTIHNSQFTIDNIHSSDGFQPS